MKRFSKLRVEKVIVIFSPLLVLQEY